MSLSRAIRPNGASYDLPGPGPVPAVRLKPLRGEAFVLPVDDVFVLGTGTEAHGYLDAARAAWDDHPEYMDLLDEDSPAAAVKAAEAALYRHHWAPWFDGAREVLDIGCGVGRMSMPVLDRGGTVWGVDADLFSLRRFVWHAAGRPGALDLSWSSVHTLPDVQVDAVIACEVWCYVPDVERAVAEAVARLRPGGVVCCSMEARWGWAASPDAPPGGIAHALVGDGVVDLPGEGWVRTWEQDELVTLLEDAGLAVEGMAATHYVLDGPLENVLGPIPDLDVLLDLEEACRAHPVWAPLNRIWTVAARKR